MGYGDPAKVCEQAVQSYLVSGQAGIERASPEEFTKRSKEYWELFTRLYVLLGVALAAALLATLSSGTTWIRSVSISLIFGSGIVAGIAYAIAEMLRHNRTGGNSKSVIAVFRRLELAWLWSWSVFLLAVVFSTLGALLFLL